MYGYIASSLSPREGGAFQRLRPFAASNAALVHFALAFATFKHRREDGISVGVHVHGVLVQHGQTTAQSASKEDSRLRPSSETALQNAECGGVSGEVILPQLQSV